MDDARYQRCIKVTEQAKQLGIDILFSAALLTQFELD